MTIHKLDLPKRGRIKTYSVVSDIHDIHMHHPTIKIMGDMASNVNRKDRGLIINGDMLDFPFLMHKKKDFKRHLKHIDGMDEYFIPKMEESWLWGNVFLDEMEKIYDEIIFISGNHDWRAKMFREQYCPSGYHHNFDLEENLHFKKRGIYHVDYNEWLDIGDKLCLTHGMYHGSTCHKRHYEACGRSVIFGHIHKFEVKAFYKRGDTCNAWSLPCASTLKPHYLKGSANDWTNGFGTLNVRSNGYFNFQVFQLWKDALVDPYGKVYL